MFFARRHLRRPRARHRRPRRTLPIPRPRGTARRTLGTAPRRSLDLVMIAVRYSLQRRRLGSRQGTGKFRHLSGLGTCRQRQNAPFLLERSRSRLGHDRFFTRRILCRLQNFSHKLQPHFVTRAYLVFQCRLVSEFQVLWPGLTTVCQQLIRCFFRFGSRCYFPGKRIFEKRPEKVFCCVTIF